MGIDDVRLRLPILLKEIAHSSESGSFYKESKLDSSKAYVVVPNKELHELINLGRTKVGGGNIDRALEIMGASLQ